MIKIKGTCKFDYEVDLDFQKFGDIEEDNMPIEKSDDIIREAIAEKYNIDVYNIWVSPKID